MPVCIYMHGNAGCKLEAEVYAEMLLTNGINLFAFDFSGCGHSEGEWVTLGFKERNDLAAVFNYLKGLGTVSKFAFWGRSMGAATSIMYMAENVDHASVAILDSSFSTMADVVNFIAEN
jgi:alpha/beta superfamily hydrolase